MFKPTAVFASVAAFGAVLLGAAAPTPALAQASPVCAEIGPLMQRQQAIIQSINAMGRKNVDPAVACTRFNSLVSNGQRLIAFVNANKDWCQIPDDFAKNVTGGQAQAVRVRNQACGAASQRAQMERKARAAQAQRQGQEGANPFTGTDGFTGGAWRVPQGAL
jgi:hypothetical protein